MSTRDSIVTRLTRLRAEFGDLAQQIVVVGGSAAAAFDFDIKGLDVRETEDIDIVVRGGYREWQEMQSALRHLSFGPDPEHHICRMKKGDLLVDVMPTDPQARGLMANRWYSTLFENREHHNGFDLHFALPIHFVATKLEAFQAPERRYALDVRASHDIEDIVLVLFGTRALRDEITCGGERVHRFVRYELANKIGMRADALSIIQGHLPGDEATQSLADGLLEWFRQLQT